MKTVPSVVPSAADAALGAGAVTAFIERHFRHFNAAALKDAADGYRAHLDAGGLMLMTLAAR